MIKAYKTLVSKTEREREFERSNFKSDHKSNIEYICHWKLGTKIFWLS